MKGFYYEGNIILGYQLRLVKDKGSKRSVIFNQNFMNQKNVVKTITKTNSFKGKR